MKAIRALTYGPGAAVRLMHKRDEHHRINNDAMTGPKGVKLWGPGVKL